MEEVARRGRPRGCFGADIDMLGEEAILECHPCQSCPSLVVDLEMRPVAIICIVATRTLDGTED